MPNELNVQTAYVTTGNPDTYNDSALYAGGGLGQVLERNDRSYQLVKCDSGATAATATGVVAANQLAFWKDKANYIVTNNSPQALGGQVANAYRNFVAGVFRNAVTAGYYCFVLQRGLNVPVKSAGAGGVGQILVANSGTAADTTNLAVAGNFTYMPLGVEREASGGGNINVDLNIPSIP